MSNKEIAAVLGKNIQKFDSAFFLEHAYTQEGLLFPDTYFFSENVTAEEVEKTMIANFNKRIAPWRGEIEMSGHTERDVIIMDPSGILGLRLFAQLSIRLSQHTFIISPIKTP